MNNNYIIYHQVKAGIDCPDGICAAWIAATALKGFGLGFYLVPSNYKSKEEYLIGEPLSHVPCEIEDSDWVIMVDFSYPAHILQAIHEQGAMMIILDHHPGKLDNIGSLADVIEGGLDLNECGATFAWKHFFPEKSAPWFLKHVRRRDMGADGYYHGKCPEAEAITAAMSARREGLTGIEAFPVFDELCLTSPRKLHGEGIELILKRDSLINEEIKHSYPVTLLGHQVAVCVIQDPECDKHVSMLGNKLCQLSGADFAAVIYTDKEGVSFRSNGFDVKAIAEHFGGGGHIQAAGCKLSPALYEFLQID
jgi:uncharacterized protein